jgi:hypothetical protein
MGKFGRSVAIGAAVVTGPLLALAATSIQSHVAAEQAPDDDFSLDGAFVDPTAYNGYTSPSSGDPIDVYGFRWDGGGFGGGSWALVSGMTATAGIVAAEGEAVPNRRRNSRYARKGTATFE